MEQSKTYRTNINLKSFTNVPNCIVYSDPALFAAFQKLMESGDFNVNNARLFNYQRLG